MYELYYGRVLMGIPPLPNISKNAADNTLEDLMPCTLYNTFMSVNITWLNTTAVIIHN